MDNIFSSLPEILDDELIEDILQGETIRIERIISKGQTSPQTGWYDQDEHEWVILLRGAAKLLFEDGREVSLSAGDYINIPAHQKHKVSWTDPHQITVWLAVFY